MSTQQAEQLEELEKDSTTLPEYIPKQDRVLAQKHEPFTKRLVKGFILHARRIALEILNFFINQDWLYWMIGRLNKKYGFLKSVFLVYPAIPEYALAYLYPKRIKKLQWRPWPNGILIQDRKLTIMFCITSSDADFSDPCNKEKLKDMESRMSELCELLNAEQKTFAGILPGVLFMNRIVRETPEANVTAKVVVQAISKLRKQEGIPERAPVIILGGNGFTGRRVRKLLPNDPDIVRIVDLTGEKEETAWPEDLRGKPAIVLNIARRDAIGQYIDRMWPGLVVLNEVFPEPSYEEVQRMQRQGVPCYHITGVKAKAFPSFPRAYAGGIPCCAAWDSPNIEALIKKL